MLHFIQFSTLTRLVHSRSEVYNRSRPLRVDHSVWHFQTFHDRFSSSNKGSQTEAVDIFSQNRDQEQLLATNLSDEDHNYIKSPLVGGISLLYHYELLIIIVTILQMFLLDCNSITPWFTPHHSPSRQLVNSQGNLSKFKTGVWQNYSGVCIASTT